MLRAATPERVSAFSDAVFAVLITILVLDLRPPEQPTFAALLSLWPTWLSYAVSYVFIAIVWTNQPVAFYAMVFFLVNATYVFLIWELVDRRPVHDVPRKVRKVMHARSLTTMCLFGVAAVLALKYPLAGLGLCVCCLVVYLRPEAPGTETPMSRGQ